MEQSTGRKIGNYFKLLLFSTILFTSCNKDSNSDNQALIPDGTVQYKINGELITVYNTQHSNGQESTLFIKYQAGGAAISNAHYYLHAEKGIPDMCSFSILSDSLAVQSYSYDSTVSARTFGALVHLYHNGQSSGIVYSGDSIYINVSSYKSGLVSGTFTARLTPVLADGRTPVDPTFKGTIMITEGQFKNIKCLYE